MLGRVQTWAFCRNVIANRRSGRCRFNALRFAAPADPPCCRFSSAHYRMFRYAARASSDVFLCSSRRADTGTIHCSVSQSVSGATMEWTQANTLGLIALYEKMSVLWDPNHPKYNKLHQQEQRTIGGSQHAARSSMRAVLSEPKPRVEQDTAPLRYGRLLKFGRGLRFLTIKLYFR